MKEFWANEDSAELDVCPICSDYIEPDDGDDNGYGELSLYWRCEKCGTRGWAVIDIHHDNEFVRHEVDEG